MGNARLAQKGDRKQGDLIIFSKAITSSTITTTAAALTAACSGGKLLCVGGIFATDSTGLAGGTDLQLSISGETYGLNIPVADAISGLGASITHAWGMGISDDTTTDRFVSVEGVPFLLESGDSVQIGSSGADCTGAGVVFIVLLFRRIDKGADIPTT